MEGLALLAAADLAQRQKADYAADVLWYLTRAVNAFFGNRHFSLDPPSRFARMIEGRAEPEDTRTEQQIADDVIARLEAQDLEEVKP